MSRILLAFAIIAALTCHACAEFPEKITIDAQVFPLLSVEKTRELGFHVEDIPWKDNAAGVYVEAINLYEKPSDDLDYALSEAAKTLDFKGHEKEVEALFQRNQRVFELIVEADLMRCATPRSYPPAGHEGVFLAVTPGLQPLSRFLRYHIAWDIAHGRPAAAIKKCMLALRLGKRALQGETVISYLTGSFLQQAALSIMDRAIASGKMNADALQSLAAEFPRYLITPAEVVATLKGEHVFALAVLDASRDFTDAQKADIRKDLVEMNTLYTKAFMERPLHELLGPKSLAVRSNIRLANKEVQFIEQALQTAVTSYAALRLRADSLQLRIALEQYKLADGKYPKTLATLAPKYLTQVPNDPYGGKPFGYRLDETGHYTFWSVGRDLKDDGGKGNPKYTAGGPDTVFTNKPPEKQKEMKLPDGIFGPPQR